MATIYVSKDGNDSNAGTDISSPKLTLDSAISASSRDGAVEIIDSETYTPPGIYIRGTDVRYDLTIVATGSNTPIINGAGTNSVAFYVAASGTIFRGLEFANFKEQPIEIHSSSTRTSNGCLTFITGCYFRDNGGTASIPTISGLGGHTSHGSAKVTRCKIINNTGPGIDSVQDFVRITNCLIVTNGQHGITGSPVTGAARTGMSASFCTIVTLDSSGDPFDGFAIKRFGGSVSNCLVSGSRFGISSTKTDSGHFLSSNNFVLADEQTHGGLGLGSSSEAGLNEIDYLGFDNYREDLFNSTNASGGYHLATASSTHVSQDAASPIDAGNKFTNAPTIDLDGNIRPYGGTGVYDSTANFDIGCYEFIPIPWTEFTTSAPEPDFDADFTINAQRNTVSQQRRNNGQWPPSLTGVKHIITQPPYSSVVPGAANLRGRTAPYMLSNGGDPTKYTVSSSNNANSSKSGSA